VIYIVYKLSLNYRSFKAIAGCPPDSSSSRTARQHTELAAGSCPDIITKKPMASKFAEYKPNGLSRMGCNVGNLPQV